MIEAILTLVVPGAFFGVFLYVASRFFSVQIDPRAEKIAEVLPGANCGGCAFGGCTAYAKAIAAGAAQPGRCGPGGEAVARRIAEILGVEFTAEARKVSVLLCAGDSEKCRPRARYDGVADCVAALHAQSAAKACSFGCLCLGTCARVCPFDAIVTGPTGLPFVLEDRCTSCGKCVDACPKKLFQLRSVDSFVHVRCSSHDRGPDTKKACSVGCIACGACVKACKFDAIKVVDNLAVIDYAKCKSCGACVGACPQHTIWTYRKVRKDRAKATSGGEKPSEDVAAAAS